MPDPRQPRALLLLAWALGVWTLLTGITSGRLTHIVAGGALVVLSILTLSRVLPIGTAGEAPAAPARDAATDWGWVGVTAGVVFVGLALLTRLAGVLSVERDVYEGVLVAVPKSDLWRSISRFGSNTVLFPAAVFLIVLLPGRFLRHWWLWAAAMLLASGLEGLGKLAIGRTRPHGLALGFPSGHAAAAAAFYTMAAYFAAGAMRGRRARWIPYAVAAVCIGLVAFSRMALRAHWPFDVVGGAALGLGVAAGAVWWHERHPDAGRRLATLPAPWTRAIYRWQSLGPVALVALLLLKPPMAEGYFWLDLLAFDIPGGLCTAAGLLLRLWIAGHTHERALVPRGLPAQFETSGPYAYMRQPRPLSMLLIGLGVALLGESAAALTLIPAVLVTMYRITIPLEEAHFRARFGAAYDDYCARVPRFPRPSTAMAVAAARELWPPSATSWPAIRQELPAAAVIVALAVLADTHALLPHLLP